MASTNMTEHLKLNQWIGSDKPKMADFNADNRKVDQAVGSHTAGQTMHLTEAERAAWNKAIPIVGGYTGDGTPMRAVEMGVAPRFGILYAVDKVPIGATATSGTVDVYSGFFSQTGCSQGLMLNPGDTAFTALNVPQAVYGRIAKLNEKDVKYVYILFA